MSAEDDLAAGLSPEELVPGDLAAMEAITLDAYAMADQLADTRRGLAYIDLDGQAWAGAGGEAYRAAHQIDLTQLTRAVTAFDEAEAALASYAGALIEARTQAAAALEDYRLARAAQAQALADCQNPPTSTPATTTPAPITVPYAPVSPLSASISPLSATVSPTATDPYGLAAAVAKLIAARDHLDRVGTTSARALRDAADLIPQVNIPQYSAYTPGNPFPAIGHQLWDFATSPYRVARGWGTTLVDGLAGLPGEASPPGSPQRAQGDYYQGQARQGHAEMTDAARDFIAGSATLATIATLPIGAPEEGAVTLLERLLARGATDAIGETTPGLADAAGKKLLEPSALADRVADATGGVVTSNKGGYTVKIPYGRRSITVRVMERGGPRTNYYRVSVPGKAAYTVNGEPSTDAGLTHIDISQDSLKEISSIIARIRGGS